jgi:uncharacterized membrane protein
MRPTLALAVAMLLALPAAAPAGRPSTTGPIGPPARIRLVSVYGVNASDVVLGVDVAGAIAVWNGRRVRELGLDESQGLSFSPVAINGRGDVAGEVTPDRGDTRGYFWHQGTLDVLEPLPGDFETQAFGLNDGGMVVGYSLRGAGYRAVAWLSGGPPVDLSADCPQPTAQSRAWAVNNAGVVLLSCQDPATETWQFYRLVGGVPEPLLGFEDAEAINAGGAVAGTIAVGDGGHAALWSRGRVRDLGVLPGDVSSAAGDVNSFGDVIGASGGPSGGRSFYWNRRAGLLELPQPPGATCSPNGLDARIIVGTCVSPTEQFAVAWPIRQR